jgi:hypothetical protein
LSLNHFFNQQLNSSRWPIYCGHSVTSADVRLSVDHEASETMVGVKSGSTDLWVMRPTELTTAVHFNDLTPPGTTKSHWKDSRAPLLDHSRTILRRAFCKVLSAVVERHRKLTLHRVGFFLGIHPPNGTSAN